MRTAAQVAATLERLVRGALDAINRVKRRRAVDNVADTISNGGVQHDSDKTFSELADKSGDSKTE